MEPEEADGTTIETVASEAVGKMIERLEAAQLAFQAEMTKRADERDAALCAALEKKIAESADELRKESARSSRVYSLPGSEPTGDDIKDFSFVRLSRAIATGNWTKAGLEREICEQTAKALGTDVDAQAGYLVPVQQITEMIEMLRADVVALQLGATMMGGLSGSPVYIPRQSETTTGYWIAENQSSDITASDPTIEQVSLTPHTLAALVEVSNQFMEESQPAAEGFIRQDLTQQFARTLDSAVLLGTGASGEPRGIVNQSGINTSAIAADPPTYNELLNIVAQVRNSNALRGSLGWALSPQSLNSILQMLDVSSGRQALERRVVSNGPMDRVLGYPYATTTALDADVEDANAVIFGDWSQVRIAEWAGMRVAASDSAGSAFERDQMKIRATWRIDILVRHPQAFCASS